MDDTTKHTANATTDVGEFFSDLDGGMFERMLSKALSDTAAAAVDNDKTGKVTVDLTFKKIPGTAQVHCAHTIKFVCPTSDGKRGEEATRTIAMHVGQSGRLSLAPENQLSFLGRAGQPA